MLRGRNRTTVRVTSLSPQNQSLWFAVQADRGPVSTEDTDEGNPFYSPERGWQDSNGGWHTNGGSYYENDNPYDRD